MNENCMEEAIKERLRNRYLNWNKGQSAWLQWSEIMYEPDACYSIEGERFTLQEYKDYMCEVFKVYEIEIGDLHNLLMEDNWCSIRHTVHIRDRKTGDTFSRMIFEFVQFKNNSQPTGARITEGWISTGSPSVLSKDR